MRKLWLAGGLAGVAIEEVSKAMTEETLLALACVGSNGWTSPRLLSSRARPAGRELTACVSTPASGVMINHEGGEGGGGDGGDSATAALTRRSRRRNTPGLVSPGARSHARSQTCDWQNLFSHMTREASICVRLPVCASASVCAHVHTRQTHAHQGPELTRCQTHQLFPKSLLFFPPLF